MKKLIYIALFLVSLTGYSQIGSGVTTVNIVLSEAYSIEVLNTSVNLVVDNVTKYENGTNTLLPNHIKISSTRPYQVTMINNQDYTFNGNTIPANKVSVILKEGSTTVVPDTPLNTTSTNIIPTTPAVLNRFFNAEYILQGGNHLLKPVGTYTAQLTYTLIPQ